MARKGFSFNSMPSVRFNRSQFPLGHDIHTSMSVGKLYPIDWQEVLPGDTFSCKAFDVTRVTSSFLKPVMDNLFLDVYHFFVPLRLVYDGAEGVFGNSSPSAYEDNDLGSMPGTYGTVAPGSVADYLGLPLKSFSSENMVTLAPFRAFALIYNQWFRNENVVNEMYILKGEQQPSELLNANAWAPNNYTGMLPSVAKYKDYFTSCLPQPQKGAEVVLPLGVSAPVVFNTDASVSSFSSGLPLKFGLENNQYLADKSYVVRLNSDGFAKTFGTLVVDAGAETSPTESQFGVTGSNLVGTVDLSQASAASINDQRFAFALQKMLERDALYGSRYNEYLLGHFGVYSPDQRLQLPEYLGGGRMPLNITQVAQTSAAADDSPLANVAGYSWSNGRTRYSKGFTEHGIVMTVAAVRYKHSYQQGVLKKWTRFQRNDFYDPLFATIGQQPVYQSELYYDGSSPLKGSVFGYSEAWAEYRSIPSTVTGQMRSQSQNSLDIWHFADNYANAPSLTPSFIEETPSNVDRTLSVPSESIDNFIVDFYMDLTAIRVMPVHSVPGLIDHH